MSADSEHELDRLLDQISHRFDGGPVREIGEFCVQLSELLKKIYLDGEGYMLEHKSYRLGEAIGGMAKYVNDYCDWWDRAVRKGWID